MLWMIDLVDKFVGGAIAMAYRHDRGVDLCYLQGWTHVTGHHEVARGERNSR